MIRFLRQGKIAYTKAIGLTKIKDEQQRKQLLKDAPCVADPFGIELNLSLREIKERIKQLQDNPTESPSTTIKDLMKNIERKKLWETEPKKWEKVEKLLEKINLLLED